ncbi:hypothetical protein Trydic_g17888 [Trypoxylus dichotomus]
MGRRAAQRDRIGTVQREKILRLGFAIGQRVDLLERKCYWTCDYYVDQRFSSRIKLTVCFDYMIFFSGSSAKPDLELPPPVDIDENNKLENVKGL